jgi:hypothetical protein
LTGNGKGYPATAGRPASGIVIKDGLRTEVTAIAR